MNLPRSSLVPCVRALLSFLFLAPITPTLANSLPFFWREVGPPTRSDHAGVYDPVGDRLVIFGGTEGATRHDDVWMLSLSATPAWSQPPVFSLRPSARSGHTAVYDPVRQRMIVFGGNDGSLRNDVWALSLSGTLEWKSIEPSGTPPSARQNHTAIYDPSGDRMLVFGGNDGVQRNDVWALTLSASPTWTLLTAAGAPPSAREGASAIYDLPRERMLVFGGLSATTHQNDTWSLSLAGPPVWSTVATAGTLPSARSFHDAIYDPVRDRMIVTWGEVTLPSQTVMALTLGGGTPQWQTLWGIDWSTRLVAAYDPVRDRLLFHGGSYSTFLYFNQAGALNLSPAVSMTVPIPPGVTAWAWSDASGIFDPTHGRFVMFGGFHSDGFEGGYNSTAYGADIGSGTWTNLGSLTNTLARAGHTANYVPSGTPRMVVFGGACLGSCSTYPYNDVWQLPLDPPGAWQQITPNGTPPAPRSRHSSIYDPVRNSLIVFGGIGSELMGPGTRYNDVWELNLNGIPTWSPWTPLGTPPSARCGHSAVYDPINQRMVVFGGRDAVGVLADVWSLSLTGTPTWTPITPAGPVPSPREEHVGLYYAYPTPPGPFSSRMMLVYGGMSQSDVWSLSLDGSPTWSQAEVLGTRAPFDAHSRLAAAVDNQNAVWMFGGNGMTPWKLVPYIYTGVDDGPSSEVQLLRPLPNPSRGPLVIGFALRDQSPAKLELFDLAGRRIESREVGTLGTGVHRVPLGTARMAVGTYLVRLRRSDGVFSVKAVVMR